MEAQHDMPATTDGDGAAGGDRDRSGTEEARARRAARVAAMQKQQRRSEGRRRLGVIAAVVAVVLALAGGTAAVILTRPEPPSLDAVKTYAYEGSVHQEGAITYAESPPVGGPHNSVWLNCGIYDAPVPDENAVHSMEHGAVWITYRPDLPAEQVAELKTLVADQSYVVLSPYEGLPSPVVASAWNHQLQVDDAGDARLGAFLREYVQGAQTPEPGASCSGTEVGTPTG
ncbi:DUF3105 domain-containing protein [Kineococcus glutinatus]|uniref:DUF3105 domain-containing protein n=1 Tax=Kineococcus glutinatus TaxID=1070872 RepID=A0ABP9HY60_9ACTN